MSGGEGLTCAQAWATDWKALLGEKSQQTRRGSLERDLLILDYAKIHSFVKDALNLSPPWDS